jgi:excisionase family DNA binding protein
VVVSDADAPAQKQFFLRRSLCTFGQAGFAAFSVSGLVGILSNAEVFGQKEKSMEHLLTVDEVAELLQVPVSWVYTKTRSDARNRFPGIRLGKYWRFRGTKNTDGVTMGSHWSLAHEAEPAGRLRQVVKQGR